MFCVRLQSHKTMFTKHSESSDSLEKSLSPLCAFHRNLPREMKADRRHTCTCLTNRKPERKTETQRQTTRTETSCNLNVSFLLERLLFDWLTDCYLLSKSKTIMITFACQVAAWAALRSFQDRIEQKIKEMAPWRLEKKVTQRGLNSKTSLI